MPSLPSRPTFRRPRQATDTALTAPPDPRTVAAPLDPLLESIRSGLRPHLRRLWLRRIVRRAWLVAGVVAAVEVGLFLFARFVPIEFVAPLAIAIPIVGLVVLLVLAAGARPRLGETAIAVDAEGHLGDRVASALALAAAFPSMAGPPAGDVEVESTEADEVRETERFVRRQRADAASSLRLAPPNLF